jgi:hypothetical protein
MAIKLKGIPTTKPPQPGELSDSEKRDQWRAKQFTDYKQGKNIDKIADIFSGSPEARMGDLIGRAQMQQLYGRDMAGTGLDVQDVRNRIKSRMVNDEGGSIADNQLRGQRNSQVQGIMANAAQQGIKGGVRAGMANQAARSADRQIAQVQNERARQNLMDYKDVISNEAGNQMSYPMARSASAVGQQQISPASQASMFGKVLCTELHRQGYMSNELYAKDADYGVEVGLLRPHVVIGYHLWAKPVVKLMEVSPLFTKVISYPVLKWAKHIAGEEKSLFGYFAQYVGETFCGVLGKIVIKLTGVKYASN